MCVVGCADDIINSRGLKVSLKHIERVLCEMPGVIQAGIVAVPDSSIGHAITAILVLDGHTLTRADVLAHCRQRLEAHLVPKRVEFRDQLP